MRHGQTDWNLEDRFQGSTDIPLNNTGREQAEQAFEATSKLPIDIIVTSDLSRAKETAEILNRKMELPLILEPRLRERNFGDWQGKVKTEFTQEQIDIRRNTPELIEKGGETYKQLETRAFGAINEHLNDNPDKNILFVCHGNIHRILNNTMFEGYKLCDNATPYLFKKTNHSWEKTKCQ